MLKEKTIIQEVKPQEGQTKMRFVFDLPEGTEPNSYLEFTRGLISPYFQYHRANGVTKYSVEKVWFYTKFGVAYSIKLFDKAHRDFAYIVFDQPLVMRSKKNVKFDGKPFFISRGKPYREHECEVYLPIEYLEAIGYTVVEIVKKWDKYRTDITRELITPYFDTVVFSRLDDDFETRLADLKQAILKAKSKQDLVKALQETMGMQNVRV